MSKLSRTRIWVCFGLVMMIGCLAAGSSSAALFGLFKSKSSRSAASSKPASLIVFPFDQTQGAQVPVAMGENLASALRTMLGRNTQYTPLLYNERLAPIQRARAESTLNKSKGEDIGPFAEDRAKPLKLARLLASDFFLVGSVEDVQIESSKKIAEMTVSVELVDAKTGRLIKALLVTGRTPEDATGANEQDAIALAAGDAIAKLKAQLIEDTKPAAKVEAASKPASAEAPKAADPAPSAAPGK